jgi:hypothetical protein
LISRRITRSFHFPIISLLSAVTGGQVGSAAGAHDRIEV